MPLSWDGSELPAPNLAKPTPRVLERAAKVKDAEKHERKVYAAVDRRDRLRCVITGRKANPHSVDSLERLHHHHILQRGRDQGPTETWNVCSVHATAHALIHRNEVTLEGNADIALRIGIKASTVEELFGHRRPGPRVQVIPDAQWASWLDEHATRQTAKWTEKVGR